MKSKLILLFSLLVIFSFIIIVHYISIKNIRIKTKDIVKVTVQYRTNRVLIEDPDDLQIFYDNINKDFKLHNLAIGRKGWIFWIKCYDSNDKLVYNFTILSDNLIKFNGWFYKSINDFDLHYFENLFNEEH
jgi:hypothetical protein